MTKYNIIGIIVQPHYENVIFQGEFEHDDHNFSLEGRLNDKYGNSKIKGLFDPKERTLEFNKQYIRRGDVVRYHFRTSELHEQSLLVGKFHGKLTLNGESYCEVYSPEENPKYDWNQLATEIKVSLESFEELNKTIIKSLVDKGLVEENLNPKTGEMMYKIKE